jgi:iron complex outermembrane receptor protein
MKFLSTILYFLLTSLVAYAQQPVPGKVITESGEPVQGATIFFKSKQESNSTVTNEAGEFTISVREKVSYGLRVNHVGFEPFSDSWLAPANLGDTIKITLLKHTQHLQAVEVIGRNIKKYNSDYSFGATRTATLNKDIPQSISTITKELVEDRQAFQLADAVKISSGVIPSSFYNQYAIRGISQNEEGQVINGMRTRQYYFLQPLTSNIERIEVIKGPASATFASVDPGGTINLVTKKPLATSRKEITLGAGSFSTIRGTLDFTGPMTKDGKLLYRLNGAFQEARSYRDYIGNKSFLLSPSISYIANEKTAINAEMIYSNMAGNLDRGQPIFGAVAGVTNLNSTPSSLNLGAPNDFFRSKDFMLTGNFSHKFNKNIAFVTSYMKQTWTEDLQEHRTTNAFAPDLTGNPVTSLAAMQFVQRKQNWNTDNLNSYLNFDLKSGSVKHKVLVGYDLHYWQKLKGGGQNAARGFLLKDGSVAPGYVVANQQNYQTITIEGITTPRPNVSFFNLNNPTGTVRNVGDYNLNVRTALPAALTTTNAVFLQEQLSWQKFTVLLSLRKEWFKDITNHRAANELSFTNTALLPRIGLTYSILKNINIYGTYLEGFQPQSNTVTLMPNTGRFFGTAKSAALFQPLKSNLKEAGFKSSWFGNQMELNASVYVINQKNVLMSANIPEFPDSLVTRGADRSRGFELDIAGHISPDWQVNASYSYIDAKIVNDAKAELIGQRKENTPVNSANLWTRYNFNRGFLRDIGIGFGTQYSGNKVPWFTRSFRVPGYTLLDAALYFKPQKSPIQVALNVNNLTNKTYWIGAQNYLRLFPGAPRNFVASMSYRF